MTFILIIITPITTEIHMALDTKLISLTIVNIDLLDSTIAATVQGHLQSNVLTIFTTL